MSVHQLRPRDGQAPVPHVHGNSVEIVEVPVPQVAEQFVARCVAVPTLLSLKDLFEEVSLVLRNECIDGSLSKLWVAVPEPQNLEDNR